MDDALPSMEEGNRAISERKGLGSDEVGLSLWGKLTGYSKRALVETGFSKLKNPVWEAVLLEKNAHSEG